MKAFFRTEGAVIQVGPRSDDTAGSNWVLGYGNCVRPTSASFEASLTDERTRAYDDSRRAQAFLPSRQLNLADVHRRAGPEMRARHFLEASAALDELPRMTMAQ